MNTPIPIDPALLEFLRAQGLGAQMNQLEKELGTNLSAISTALDAFVTQDPACIELKRQARALTVHDDTVLIQGDTGTGKEIIAKVLGSNRMKGNFVAVNVAAIPKELVESTLFGYSKGAFTGAALDKIGLVQHAGEGTLFLDEIGDLSLDMQAKFLRVMQDRRVRKIGALDEEEVKCRFIAATHFNLKDLVEKKLFRLDLYARLTTFILTIPPLTSRLSDIPLIMSKLNPKFPCDKVNWAAVDLSLNVRSLQQYARRYAVLNTCPN